jgi:hypothetical protein
MARKPANLLPRSLPEGWLHNVHCRGLTTKLAAELAAAKKTGKCMLGTGLLMKLSWVLLDP